jgi:hypothetical protein
MLGFSLREALADELINSQIADMEAAASIQMSFAPDNMIISIRLFP